MRRPWPRRFHCQWIEAQAAPSRKPYEVDIERARYYTGVWREMEEGPSCMRAARALEETLRNMRIRIDDDELLVGVKTAKRLPGSSRSRGGSSTRSLSTS
ncbi:MAG: pyruvate formate lyase family protein [Actinomycetota bacterium]|nr:pyruvate formate lyase family protein [Actinomycetota bacterium]